MNIVNSKSAFMPRKKKDWREGTPSFRGSELLDLFLKLFEGRFKVIHARWYGDGDNLTTFNRLTKMGTDPETAARNTWTGKQAVRRGYTLVRIGEITGNSGDYAEVDVYFEKPPQ